MREIVDEFHIRPNSSEQTKHSLLCVRKLMLMRIMGVVTKVLNNHEYIIYFLQTKEDMIFNHAKLLPHLEFIDNK